MPEIENMIVNAQKVVAQQFMGIVVNGLKANASHLRPADLELVRGNDPVSAALTLYLLGAARAAFKDLLTPRS